MSRTCINCGQELADKDKFCSSCGTFNPPEEIQEEEYADEPEKEEDLYNPYEAGKVYEAIKEKKSHNKAWLIVTVGVIIFIAIVNIGKRSLEIRRENVPAAKIVSVPGEVGQTIETEDFDFIIKGAMKISNEKINSILPEGKKMVAVKAGASNLKDKDIFEEYPDIYGIYDGDHYVQPIEDYEVRETLSQIGYNSINLNDLKYDNSIAGYLVYIVDADVKEITLAYSELNISSLKGNTIGNTYEVAVPIKE